MEPAVGPSIPESITPLVSTLPIESMLAVVFTIIFIWWAIFTAVLSYHWLRYGRDSWVAVPVLALHLVVSGWIFIFATGGFR